MIGKRLRNLRKKSGLTQAELGSELGLSASAVGMYEQNRREPDNRTLIKYAEFFDVTVDFLVGADSGEQREVVDEIRRLIQSHDGLMFNGEALSSDDLEQILHSIEVGTAVAMAKKKKDKSE
ncbi:MAG: helix-turn-helix transcriptional regulator [Clostridiales bacterium]|nr:helix-turn-helix transcriptional regulator [Clostridiales bacterium]